MKDKFLIEQKNGIEHNPESNLTDEEVKDIVYKVVTNEDRFMQEKAFSNIIEVRVAKKIVTLLSDENEYKRWKKGEA